MSKKQMGSATEETEFAIIRGVLFSKKTEVSYSPNIDDEGMDEVKIVVYKMINNKVVEKQIRLFNSFEMEGEEREWFEVPEEIVKDIFEEELKIGNNNDDDRK